MASIRAEIVLEAHPDDVWAVVRDTGAVHRRLARGFVLDVQQESGSRVVTYANGTTVREVIVDIDDEIRRLAYAVVGGRAKHHNASMQVIADGHGGTYLIWISDLMPDEVAGHIRWLIEQEAIAIKRTMENPRI